MFIQQRIGIGIGINLAHIIQHLSFRSFYFFVNQRTHLIVSHQSTGYQYDVRKENSRPKIHISHLQAWTLKEQI
jgi:hypothetical protein